MNRPAHCTPGLFALVLLLAPAFVLAQAPDEAQMRRMMEQAQKMQDCMTKVDQGAMEAMAAEGQAFSKKVEALCAAGKRDEAMSQAMDYGRRISASEEVQQMRKCGEMMKGMMPEIPMPKSPEEGGKHICDE